MVRVLASHQCGLGLIPCPGVICGLSLFLVLVLTPRVFLQVLQFFSLHKSQRFQIPSGISGQRATLGEIPLQIPIYCYLYFLFILLCSVFVLYVIYFSLHSRPVPTSCRLCPGYIAPTVPSGACAASTSEGKFRIYWKQPF